MKVDMRTHQEIRDQVHAGLSALRVQGRQIWGDTRHSLSEIAVRLMVGVGDVARLSRNDPNGVQQMHGDGTICDDRNCVLTPAHLLSAQELKKELGNVILSTIRWIDDLGLDVLECLDLAIEAQEKFAASGRAR